MLALQVARVVVGVDPGSARGLVVLTNQLVGRIVAIGVALGVVAEIGNVTVAVIAVVIVNIPAGAGIADLANLIGRLAGGVGLIEIGLRQYCCTAVFRYLLIDPPIGIIGVVFGDVVSGAVGIVATIGYTGDPIIVIVGILRGTGTAVYGFYQGG